MKQSCCLFPDAELTLNEAEDSMLELLCQRAQMSDGLSVLELSQGWGSLGIYIAAKYPTSQVTVVCDNHAHRLHIGKSCRQRGLSNLQVIVKDFADLRFRRKYDRVLLIEMLGPPETHKVVLYKVSTWLSTEGIAFIQTVCSSEQRQSSQGHSNQSWLLQHLLPSMPLPSFGHLCQFQEHLSLQQQWYVNGQNYSRTLDAWLQRLNSQKAAIMHILQDHCTPRERQSCFAWSKLVYLVQSELFGYANGTKWGIGHYTFVKQAAL